MPGELVFEVVGAVATPATPVTLSEAGLRERSDLQEWVLAHPAILGSDVMVIAFEFDQWLSAAGERERDRLDVLGLGSDGRLVVAELKRDRAPETVNMQALKYAAMASRFTDETLVEHFVAFRARKGLVVTEEEAREELLAHAGDLDTDQLRKPRIVLVAGSFPTTVTATAVWLNEMGLDITLQRVQAYRLTGNQVVVTASQLFPVPDVEEFAVSPQRAQVKASEERRKTGRERSTVHKLIASRTVADGTRLTLQATNEVTPDVRAQLETWVAEDPRRGRATWFNRSKEPLRWDYDGQSYRPTPLVAKMLVEAADVERSPRGPAWWFLPDGRALTAVVTSLTGRAGFNWSVLHELLAAVPEGRWTTYGDLADVVGTAAQSLGQHVVNCPDCQNAHRVLSSQGRVAENFCWSDPEDQRDPMELLRSEGLSMPGGAAAPEARLSPDELGGLLLATVEPTTS